LFQQPAPQLAKRNPENKSIKELPGGAASLVAEAQNYFSARQYDKAADDYQKILQHDENNGLALANLATIEMEQGRLDDAEKHIQAAVVQSPNDAYNLSTLGRLEFLREKYDEALDALSRAARLDPRNPEISKLSRRYAQSQGPAQAGGNGVAQGDSTRSQLRAGTQQSGGDLHQPAAAPGGTGALALSKGARRRPAAQSGPGESAGRERRAGECAVKSGWMDLWINALLDKRIFIH